MSARAGAVPFSCTVMTAAQGAGHATKEIIAHPVTGLPIKNQARDLGIWRGEVQHIQLAGLQGLGALLPTLTKRQALIHGAPIGTTPDTRLPLVMEEKLGQRGTPPNAIARTLTHFAYTSPHLLMFDIDPDPLDRYVIHTAEELIEKLVMIWPVFAEIGYLSTCSTSAAIYDKKTGAELTPPYGLHVYILAQGDVARFRELATIKLWCAETGYCRLATPNKRTGVAAILERCLTDLSVWSPERLDYVSGAEIAPKLPFVQRRPLPALQDGTILDLDTLPDVTHAERAEYVQRLADEKARIAPERFQVCVAHLKTATPDLPEDAITEEVTKRIDRANHDWLAPDHVIELARGGTLLAGEITRKHDGLACADPMEPDYGPNHAKIFWDADKPHWVICSLAHGFKRLFFPEPQAPEPPPVDDEDMEHLLAQVEAQTSPLTAPSPEDPATSLGTVSPCTQGANAQRIHRAFEGKLYYTTGAGWLFWTGSHWRIDPSRDDALTTGFVRTLPTLIAQEAQTLTTIALSYPPGREQKDLLALASDRLQWAIRSDNASAITGALKMAKSSMLILNEAFDAQPWLFNCRNGTIDLKSGARLDHDPAHLLTRCAPVTFDPDATCPRWQKFLTEVFAGDTAMVDFLQRAIGWSLTGVVQERALFFLYGASGYNGKTTVVETVKELLGACGEEEVGYARKVNVGTFMRSKNSEEDQRKMAALVGPRFVYTSEVDESHRLNEQLIKDITGGDTVDARRLYHETFAFKPTFKPWMYGNYKPDIRGTDDAIWGRVKLIPFEVSFKDHMDLTLAETLKGELSGILNWALAGCRAWQKQGLQPPPKVEDATKAYRAEQDVFAPFITDMCDILPEASVKTATLWTAYKRWCARNDREEETQTRLGNYLTAKGYLSDGNKSGRGAIRSGLDLKKEPEPDEDPAAWEAPPATPATPPATPSATPSPTRGSSLNGSNDATNFTSDTDLLPLATHKMEKSREEGNPRDFPEKGIARGSSNKGNHTQTRTNTNESASTPPLPRGSKGVAVTRFCSRCGEETTHGLEGGALACSSCSTIPAEKVFTSPSTQAADPLRCPKAGTHKPMQMGKEWRCSGCNALMTPPLASKGL